MALAKPMTLTSPAAPTGLAAARPGLFRRAMAETQDPAAARERAKSRLYVVCQAGGWLLFLGTQLLFIRLFKSTLAEGETLAAYASIVQTVCLGVLITHYSRRWIQRWGWKDLGWRKLAWRIPAFAAWLGLVWCVLGYAIFYGLLQQAWTLKQNPIAIFSVSLINATAMIAAWLCLYFFYHLADRYNRLELEQLRLAANVKDAELRALKSQINPHFLFNSLNSLRALIGEDPPRAREAVTRLANMLRYSLQSGAQETVAFEEELRIVEDYLALEQIRHENRLTVRWEIADDARLRALPVPPMLLQTLVENAVKYGISPRRQGGKITITAACNDEGLSLRVTNPRELAAVPSGSTGLGLRNAGERLKLLFGTRATLALTAAPAGYVTAAVFIPVSAELP